MWKKKILIQTCACLVITAAYTAVNYFGGSAVSDVRESAVAAMSKHYTVSDIWDNGKKAVSAAVKAPVAVTGYIIGSQEMQQYGDPLDETETGDTASVYAVSGGAVHETGKNEKYGKYVMIQHEDAVSIYGNCSKLYVKAGEHVRKGQVIASFSKDGNKEFYYDLIEE